MKQLTINGTTWGFHEVPEGATGFKITTVFDKNHLIWGDCFLNINEDIELPPGHWSDPIKASEVTEEQAADIVQEHLRPTFDYAYESAIAGYERYDGNGLCDTATESLYSLIRSLGMEPEKTVILKKEK